MGCVSSSTINHVQDKIDESVVFDSPTSATRKKIARRKTQHLTQNIVIENSDKDIRDYYEIDNMPVLGTGISGSVKVCTHKATGIKYALKALSKKLVKREKLRQLTEEIRFMADLDHPNILRIHEYFESKDVIFLILELCRGGELLDRLHEQKGHHYSEKIACRYVHTMLSAISYCHAHNIVHRDLKLENFLFVDESPESELKLIDFGLSQYFKPQEQMHSAVGTPYYVAPEVLQGNYDVKCDVWSIGVIAYMLLSGSPPFYGKTDSDTLQSVKSGRWRFDESFRQVSEEAKDFITQCLSRRASKRPSAMGALKHSWFKLLMEPDQKNGKTLDIVSRLRKFTKRSSFAKVCMEVVAHTLLPEQISDLRKDFAKLDISNTGEITFSDLRKVLEGNGKFTVEDLSYIFNGIDWEQTGKISYHEFIAASLTTKEITEENMRVAFEKISSHADYITSDNIVDILGSDGSKEEVGNMLKELHLDTSSKITYNQFKQFMTGGASPMVNSPYTKHRKKLVFFDEERDYVSNLATSSTVSATHIDLYGPSVSLSTKSYSIKE